MLVRNIWCRCPKMAYNGRVLGEVAVLKHHSFNLALPFKSHLLLVLQKNVASGYWYMSSKGIWLTVLMRSAHFNSLTHFVVTQQPLLLHIPYYEFGGGVNQRKRVGMTYLPTMEVKNVNRCFRHLLIKLLKRSRMIAITANVLQPYVSAGLKCTTLSITTNV